MFNIKIHTLLFICTFTSYLAMAQTQIPQKDRNLHPKDSQEIKLPAVKVETAYDPRIKQSYDIIDEIKSQNVPDNFKLEIRGGLLQTFANASGSIKLNKYKSLPFIGIDTITHYFENWALELRGYYAKNMIFEPEAGSSNKEGYQTVIEVGPRYRFILDQTQIDDYVVVKALYYSLNNNFIIDQESESETADASRSSTIYMKSYTGYVGGLERSIPITPKIGIIASLDINFIQDTKSDTSIDYNKNGVGFQMRGQLTYRLDWFGTASRMGASYWQGGMVNSFTQNAQADTGKTSHVQTFRAVSLSWITHF